MSVRAEAGLAILAAPLMLAAAAPAFAQDSFDPDLTVEVTNDLRQRGLSASGGKASGAAALTVQRGAVGGEVRASALRGSARHGGADLGVEASVWAGTGQGGWRFEAGGTVHAFPDAPGEFDYGELFASASYLLGPLDMNAGAFYAPEQRSIGGENLYLRARARASLPGRPWTLVAHVGRSSGQADDPVKAARLRPAGDYVDWSLGVEWTRGPLTAGLRYGDTDIARGDVRSPFADAGHAGARITGTVGFSF